MVCVGESLLCLAKRKAMLVTAELPGTEGATGVGKAGGLLHGPLPLSFRTSLLSSPDAT